VSGAETPEGVLDTLQSSDEQNFMRIDPAPKRCGYADFSRLRARAAREPKLIFMRWPMEIWRAVT
jgi:hypothetical protein